MKITPLAAESMGTRSMATFVECEGGNLLIDPGAGLAANRFHLTPHPLEKWRLDKHMERIRLFFEKAKTIVITCFHSDHCYDETIGSYRGKMVFMQNPNSGLIAKRRRKAFHLIHSIQGLPRDIVFMNNRSFEIGNVMIHFAKPVHNTARLEKEPVVPVIIKDKTGTFFYSSNIEGHFDTTLLKWISRHQPDFLYIDGPPTFNRSGSEAASGLKPFFQNMELLFKPGTVKNVILDHHGTRDIHFRKKLESVYHLAERYGILIQTAAEYRGEELNLLEARRQQLYKDEPVS
ncbi:hypothetical protein JW948_18420 [bacterium]|nr:hypothetical protein [bacterium]